MEGGVLEEAVEEDDEFAHDDGEGHFGFFPGGAKALVDGAQDEFAQALLRCGGRRGGGWAGGYGELSVRVAETIAHIRLARTGCALECHWLARGEFPESLEALTPAFIEAVPKDIVGGGELHYRRSPSGGFVLYSLGWNGVDDDGTVDLSKNGSVDRKKGDWVWQSPPQ